MSKRTASSGHGKRRLLIAAGVAFATIGASLYYYYFMSTEAAIRYAEEFLFRRMTVAQLESPGSYRHFWVSNRLQSSTDGPLETRMSSERGTTLSHGTFDTQLMPSLGLGMILNATEWFQNEQIRLSNVQALERQAFIDKLRKFVDAAPKRSLLIVVHGFRERFPSALRKTSFVASVLDIDTPVLVFDWPGDQGSSLRGYRNARNVAEASGAELAALIELLLSEVRPDKLSIVANSMGAQVVVDAFSTLHDVNGFNDAEAEISNVILTAPDVDHGDFNATFKSQILSMASRLIVYVSSNDRALLASRWINRSTRLGESSLSPDQFPESLQLAQLIEPGEARIALIDVTPVNRTRNFHNFSLETPEFFDDLFLRLTNEDATRSRLIYGLEAPNGSVYWILTRGR